MLKRLLIVCTISCTINCMIQAQADTVFTQEQVVRIAEVVDSLQNRVQYLEQLTTINETIIEHYKINNDEIESLMVNYEKYSLIQEAQISLLDQNLKRYQEFIKSEKKPFWDKPVLWVVVGGATMYLSSKIVANVK